MRFFIQINVCVKRKNKRSQLNNFIDQLKDGQESDF